MTGTVSSRRTPATPRLEAEFPPPKLSPCFAPNIDPTSTDRDSALISHHDPVAKLRTVCINALASSPATRMSTDTAWIPESLVSGLFDDGPGTTLPRMLCTWNSQPRSLTKAISSLRAVLKCDESGRVDG